MATITHLNPEGMHANPAYTQAVVVSGPVKTIYIGGQNPVDVNGKLVGEGDIAAQTEQILDNMETILKAAGASLQDIIKMTLLLVEGTDPIPGLVAFQKRWGAGGNPPAISAAYVSSLAVPGFLAEIEAIAVVAE